MATVVSTHLAIRSPVKNALLVAASRGYIRARGMFVPFEASLAYESAHASARPLGCLNAQEKKE
jgi:hypothetical protein